ncbi:MAG: pyridoxal phosphate-dependent aminotransferase [Betaproteobacteria bacterium]|jgi:aspartate/methionine/tyrosine aminotransferase|nr:pyridoxal phosphate-dependent aminotransferase [Rhodocyclaceae bacterium]
MNSPEILNRLRHAARMDEIEPFHVVSLVTRAQAMEAAGRSVVNLVVGEPEAPAAEPIAEAGIRAIRSGRVRYTGALGKARLREAIAHWYGERYRVTVPAGRVGVMPGSSGALLMTMGVLLSPGDEVLMADPGYPCNRHFVRAMEGRAVGVPVGPDTAYQLTAALVRAHWGPRTRAVMLANPSNPTGTSVPFDELQAIHAEVRARGGTLIVDEIYHGLTYSGSDRTVLEFADDAFVINSFSKYFGMTGWRLGWMVMPEAFAPDVEKLAQNLFISASDIAQEAAIAAFFPEAVAVHEQRREAFRAQRDFLLPQLRRLGFQIPLEPEGAFYIYANCERFTGDSYRFCLDALEQAGVAIAPGLDFGSHRAAAHVRFSYPKPIEVLAEGVARLESWLKSR